MRESSASSLVRLAWLGSVVAAFFVIAIWGSASLFPGLLGNFVAGLAAFMLALAWERDREANNAQVEAERLAEQRATEVRRRFAPVRTELEKDRESLEALASLIVSDPHKSIGFTYVHPQLLEGAWNANAPRLTELVADYDLIGDLATTFGRRRNRTWSA
jgi:hypothetical protein